MISLLSRKKGEATFGQRNPANKQLNSVSHDNALQEIYAPKMTKHAVKFFSVQKGILIMNLMFCRHMYTVTAMQVSPHCLNGSFDGVAKVHISLKCPTHVFCGQLSIRIELTT